MAVREEKAGAGASGHESGTQNIGMCQLHTEGTQYGCGHYVIVRLSSLLLAPNSLFV